jgi:glyoxylase-like metal-dependent hydrolase (beta-lactamase superfamily II)
LAAISSVAVVAACQGVVPFGAATATSTPVANPARSLAAAAAFVQQGGAALVDIDYSKIEISAQQLAPTVFALTGSPGIDPGHPEAAGGRIGLLTTPDAVLMVDAQYAPLTDKVVAAVRSISSAPIRFLVNTHEHPDHVGGNANFARLSALILARDEERADLAQTLPPQVASQIDQKLLQALQAASGNQNDPLRLPAATFGADGHLTLNLNGETVELIPLPSSHTHGDTLVRCASADIMMIGDVYRNYGYPFVDPVHGGSTSGILKALDLIASLAGPNTQLVPGHGGIITTADIPRHREMIVAVQARVKQLVDQGKTLKDVLAAKPTADYDASVPGGTTPIPGGGTSADRFVGTIYNELRAG